MVKTLLSCGVLLTSLLNIARVSAQSTATIGKQNATGGPAFEVSTIKPISPEGGRLGFYSDQSGRVYVGSANTKMLIHYAFDIDESRIAGLDPATDSRRYNIAATPPEEFRKLGGPPSRATPTDQERAMLRTLLRDRFGLRYHTRDEERNVYLLTRGTGKLDLQEPKDKLLDARGGVIVRGGGVVDGESFGINLTMPALAKSLSNWLDRPVIDQTGLTEAYDFHGKPVDPGNTDLVLGFIEALPQLGLKLKAGKLPLQIMVVDQISEPTPN